MKIKTPIPSLEKWTEQDNFRLSKILGRVTNLSIDDDDLKDVKQDFFIHLLEDKTLKEVHTNFWSCIYKRAVNFHNKRLRDGDRCNVGLNNNCFPLDIFDYGGDYYFNGEEMVENEADTLNLIVARQFFYIWSHSPDFSITREKLETLYCKLSAYDNKYRHPEKIGLNKGLVDFVDLLNSGYSKKQIADMWDISIQKINRLIKIIRKMALDIGLKPQ